MKTINLTELSSMEVINLCDGSRLGYPCDYELCLPDGKINAIILPVDCGFSLMKSKEYRIPWCKIQCVGDDTILVKLSSEELSSCECVSGGRRKRGLFK